MKGNEITLYVATIIYSFLYNSISSAVKPLYIFEIKKYTTNKIVNIIASIHK